MPHLILPAKKLLLCDFRRSLVPITTSSAVLLPSLMLDRERHCASSLSQKLTKSRVTATSRAAERWIGSTKSFGSVEIFICV